MSDETEPEEELPAKTPPLPPKPAATGPAPIEPVESPDAKAIREHRERLEEADRKRGW